MKNVWNDKADPEQSRARVRLSTVAGFVSLGVFAPLFIKYRAETVSTRYYQESKRNLWTLVYCFWVTVEELLARCNERARLRILKSACIGVAFCEENQRCFMIFIISLIRRTKKTKWNHGKPDSTRLRCWCSSWSGWNPVGSITPIHIPWNTRIVAMEMQSSINICIDLSIFIVFLVWNISTMPYVSRQLDEEYRLSDMLTSNLAGLYPVPVTILLRTPLQISNTNKSVTVDWLDRNPDDYSRLMHADWRNALCKYSYRLINFMIR